ncbi:GAF domain-containing protein [Henriciella sp.]|uniref:GAF domain-containing protein n=1 Tax=Henriciella sp. TaxID=1968823 RepID=UPI0026034386|nr:GAF domain-containing protein [Henriciella sp.]
MAQYIDDEREAARLHCLRRMRILDTAAEKSFDSITDSVSRHFNVPIALISLVDEKRQWFKSRVGLDVCETEREHSFCAHAIELPDVMIVEDARLDPRFADNPLVTGAPHIRFYAGAVIKVPPYDIPIGTLCIIDNKPRTMSHKEQLELLRMCRLVTRQFDIVTRQNMDTVSEGRAMGGSA